MSRYRSAAGTGSLPALALTLVLAVTAEKPAHAETLVLDGGTLHTLVREPYVGTVLIEDGVIRVVGAEVARPPDAAVVDVAGKHVYPGLFDALSQLGLVEINSVAATVDSAELGRFNPHLQAASAIHPASEVLPVTRANGVTHALVAPRAAPETDGPPGQGDGGEAGVLPGQASLVHLAGWTIEEMLIEPAAAMVLAWPAIQTRTFDFATFSVRSANYSEAKKQSEKVQDELRDWLDAARHYARAIDSPAARARRDLKLEALAQVLDGRLPVVVQVQSARDIEAAVAFGEEQGLRMVLAGASEGYKVKELLAEKGIPVLLGLTQSLPSEEDDPYDRPFRTAGELYAAGVKIAFASAAGGGFGPGGPHSARGLAYEAAMAAAYGLPREEALRAITINPAEILGVGDQFGTIEVGKVANLIVTDGDPLEITTQVLQLVIRGQLLSTDNKHRELYERYRARP